MRADYLPYFKPSIEEDDIAAITHSLRNGWLTTGPKVAQFEKEFASIAGVKHAIALNSGTAGLQLGLIALGVGPGDEVVTPSLTFVAGANCVRQLGATPVFCDIDPLTMCATADTIAAALTARTKVIMPMQFGGHPVTISDIVALAREKRIAVLEDAAHAVGTLDNGLWPGSESDAAVFSFYATKNITSGEGGMLVTNRDDVAHHVRMLALHGMSKDAWNRYQQGGSWRYDIVATGYKNNMSDLLAALGLAQLRKLERFQSRREELARRYLQGLKSLQDIRPAFDLLNAPDRHSWCLFPVRVEASNGMNRDVLIARLREANIGTSVHFIPTHLFSAYKNSRRVPLPQTERVWEELVSLPLYPLMTGSDVDDVLAALSAGPAHAKRQETAVKPT